MRVLSSLKHPYIVQGAPGEAEGSKEETSSFKRLNQMSVLIEMIIPCKCTFVDSRDISHKRSSNSLKTSGPTERATQKTGTWPSQGASEDEVAVQSFPETDQPGKI